MRRNCTYVPGMKSRGRTPSVSNPRIVARLSSTEDIILAAANRSPKLRSFFLRSSRSTALGKYSSSNWRRLRSPAPVPGTGWMSNGRSPYRRRSFRIRSSWAVAMPLRGPLRTWIAPLQRTGGESDGRTVRTAIACPRCERFSDKVSGGGKTFPSLRMSASVRSISSVMAMFAGVPPSFNPTTTIPGPPEPGRSLANAQIASRIRSRAPPPSVSLNSTRTPSPPSIRRANSSSSSLAARWFMVPSRHFPLSPLSEPPMKP